VSSYTVIAVAVIIAILVICIVKPLRGIIYFLVNTVIGTAVIFIVNTAFPNIAVGVNPFTVFTSGVLGIPGTAMIYILKNLIC